MPFMLDMISTSLISDLSCGRSQGTPFTPILVLLELEALREALEASVAASQLTGPDPAAAVETARLLDISDSTRKISYALLLPPTLVYMMFVCLSTNRSNTMKSVPSPVLLSTPPKRFGQHGYNYSDGKSHEQYEPHDDDEVEGYANNHARQLASSISNGESGMNNEQDASTPYVVSPKRGIPIGRVYN